MEPIGSTSTSARLATALRQFQWTFDDIAFRLPRGGDPRSVTREECRSLAGNLDELARVLRAFDPDAEERTAPSPAGR